MLDYNLIQQKIMETVGKTEYNNRLLTIAEMLDRLNPDDLPVEDGVEDYIAGVISDVVLGNRSASIGKSDVLTAGKHNAQVMDLDRANVLENCGVKVSGLENFTAIRPKATRQHIVNIHERIELVKAVKEKLEADTKLTLTKMKSGKANQTMNDWLSDLRGKTIDKDSAYLNNMIDQCFEISKKNYIGQTATQSIRDAVTEAELLDKDCRAICMAHGFDFKNGSVRKLISRLKKKAKENT